MRNSLVCVFLSIVGLLSGCKTTQEGYSVHGTVERFDGKKIFLITVPVNGTEGDTLGSSMIENGEFSFKGVVDEPTVATMIIEEMRGGIPIILENGIFVAKLDFARVENSLVSGGKEQGVYNLFWKMDIRRYAEGSKLRAERNEYLLKKMDAEADEIQRRLDTFYEEMEKLETEAIRRNPDAIASAYRLSSNLSKLSLERLEERYALLGRNAKASVYGLKCEDWLRRLRVTTPGAHAPNIKAMTPEGDTISLYGIKAKYKIIEFWASWCGPCRAEMPAMVSIYKDFHKKGLEILGVSLDKDKTAWKNAIEQDGQVWLHCSDLGYKTSALARLYVVTAIPQTILLDENNVILARGLRGEVLRAKLQELLP